VDWFLYSTLWAPHALSSLLACLTGFLLLWKAPSTTGWRGLLRYSMPAAAALASSVGASIYVSLVFAAFLAVWTAVTIGRKWYRETGALLIAGSISLVLVQPYLWSLRGPAAGPASGGPSFEFTVRAFSLAALVPNWGLSPAWRLMLVNLPLVPLNYLLEFGFFFLVVAIQWRSYHRGGQPLDRGQLACVCMVGTSFAICTFLRSSVIGCNDLGWRGFLVAQFVLLLWAANLLAGGFPADLISASERRLLGLFLILGAAGAVYDLTLTRVYPMLADRGVVPPLDWMAPDRQFGKRTYAARAAYEWAHGATPETGTIQFNPKVAFQETTAMLYADRRAVAADTACNTTFGGDPKLCAPIVARLSELYTGSSGGTESACSNLPIDLVVAKDTDAVWNDRRSWVWQESAVFRSDYIRLFRCSKERVPMH
jgi:hypothetical protein